MRKCEPRSGGRLTSVLGGVVVHPALVPVAGEADRRPADREAALSIRPGGLLRLLLLRLSGRRLHTVLRAHARDERSVRAAGGGLGPLLRCGDGVGSQAS